MKISKLVNYSTDVCPSCQGTILQGILVKKMALILPDFGKKERKKKKVKAIRFRHPVPARSQKIKGFLKFSTEKSGL
jgi:hypothetical protein